MNALLEVKNIVKKYNKIAAVNKISFSIYEGICFGLLGPNGAGKTTTIEIIENIIIPSSGTVLYKGKPRSSSFREEIGIKFQHTVLLSFLTVLETLKTFKGLYHNTYDIEELVDMCCLNSILYQQNSKISGGQKQRLLLAIALINKPKLLFLDEPSTELDPQARHNLWDILLNLKKQGTTIILTTHYMEEAQYLCDEIAIMDHGSIITIGTVDELITKYCDGCKIIVPIDSFNNASDYMDIGIEYTKNKDKIQIQTNDINYCLKKLLAKNVNFSKMVIHKPDLEDVFLNLTGHALRT